jgi:hypothetical protein
MDEELKKRFIKQKIGDFIADNLKPFPTFLCERDDPHITELVRQFCFFSNKMIPFRTKHNLVFVSERLDIQRGSIDYGDLYIFVNVN